MDKLAVELNNTLKKSNAFSMLSDYGKRMYVPKGIVVQSAEAKKKASKYNATIGVALENHRPMNLPSVRKYFDPSMEDSEIFSYAPMGGVQGLREAWKNDMVKKNPLLKDVKLSLPVVCAGLTDSLSTVFALFVDKKQPVIMPDLYWENYNLIVDEQAQAKKVLFPLFEKGKFNVKGFDSAIGSVKEDKITVLLNFPNNPTGYSPSEKEADQIAKVLKKHATAGKLITVICDDAYFGLFYEEEIFKQSLFTKFCNLHKNVLAKYEGNDCLKALPFNSGYFMSFTTKCDTEDLRLLLLEKYQTGTIRLGDNLLRIAFSGIDKKDIKGLVKILYEAAESLC